jgi:putative tricarboxylic transport membrane protein
MSDDNSKPAVSSSAEANMGDSGGNRKDRLFDISFSVFLSALTAWLFIDSPNLISEVALEPEEIPPIFFPRIILFLLFCLSLIVIIKSLFGQAKFRFDLTWSGLQRMALVTLFMVGYMLIFKSVGFVLATALFLLAMTLFYGSRSWPKILAVCIIFPPIILVIFNKLFHVFLPKGLF